MNKLFNDFKNLSTSRYYLREVNSKDAKDIFEIFSDIETVKFQQIPPMETIEQAEKSIANFQKGFTDGKRIRWCIVDPNSGKALGLISLHSFSDVNSSVSIGFMLNRKYWNKGVMTEVAEKVIDYVFTSSDINNIEAYVVPENLASRKLCLKLGFEEVGFKEKNVYNIREEKYEDQYLYRLVNSVQ